HGEGSARIGPGHHSCPPEGGHHVRSTVRLKADTTYDYLPDAASRNPSNSGLNSPVRKKFSGCHCTPRQNRPLGSSIASMMPSGAVADTGNPEATRFTA